MTKISNQYSLTNILTADLANSRLGINNVSPTVALDVTGVAKFSSSVTATNLYSSGNSGIGTLNAQSITNGISLTIGDSATQHQPYLAFRRNSTGGYWAGISWYDQTTRKSFIEENSDFDLRFGTLNTLRLTIASTGAATFSSSVTAGAEYAYYWQRTSGGSNLWSLSANSGSAYIYNHTTGSAVMTILNAGNVGIGTSSPTSAGGGYIGLDIRGSGGGSIQLGSTTQAYGIMYAANGGFYIQSIASQPIIFYTSAEAMRITSGGNVLVGTSTDGGYKFEVNGGNSAVATRCISSGSTTAGSLWDGGGAPSFHAWSRPQDCGIGSNNHAGGSILIKTGMSYGSFTTGTTRIEIQSGGAVIIPGSLSKGSGSFRIDHPLKPDTHQLVHSFIEGPQADLIYRGKLTLVNGKAQANIDEVSTMTEGTFEALCREVQCFTTNENGWDLVKGKVIGNIIYIESQNPNSTDEISWMVIGERKDKHMMDTEWTDEQGKVIVEPLKQK
jgi:hypothetical protein